MFDRGYTYGEILLFLFKSADFRYSKNIIKQSITTSDDIFFNEVIDWLLKDGLIAEEKEKVPSNPMFERTVYRITHSGYLFISDLKEKRKTRIISITAVIITCLGILLSAGLQTCNQITKFEIIKHPLPPKENTMISKGKK